jgi:DNA-binding MarR family transcriptional regulator
MVDVKYRASLWRTFIDLLRTQKYYMNGIADEFGITPQMTQALMELPPSGSLTMKELAALMWCDASNVTGIVDRLEASGFVERRLHERDRRVKCVVLTASGKRLRRRIDERMSLSPPAVAALSDTDQQMLHAILERALENAHRQRADGEAHSA